MFDMNDLNLRSVGFEQITVADVPAKFDSNIWNQDTTNPAIVAIVTVETGQLRFLDTGQNPTTTVGHLYEIGRVLQIFGSDAIRKFRFIRTASTSGVLTVSYYARGVI